MRYSLLAGGKRIRPVLALATAEAIGRDARVGAAAGRGARADPHLLADPRRPAGDGRRRPAPGAPHLPQGVRRGRRDPGRRRALRRGVQAAADRAAGRSGQSAAAAELAAATGVQGMVGGQYLDVAETALAGAEGLRRLHELKTGRLIAASIECVLLLDAGRDDLPQSRRSAPSPSELGVLFQIVDDILDVTGSSEALGKQQGQRRAAGQAHVRDRVRPRRRAPAGRRVARRARGGARQAAPAGADELEQITDFIATRTY